MKRVLVFGTFDGIHPGHLFFLREAKKYGDTLAVVVTCDRHVRLFKKKGACFTERERVSLVQALRWVDSARVGDRGEEWTMIKKLKPQVICAGYDQNINHPGLAAQCAALKIQPRMVRIRAYYQKKYKTTLLRGK